MIRSCKCDKMKLNMFQKNCVNFPFSFQVTMTIWEFCSGFEDITVPNHPKYSQNDQ